ncbi:MAG: hypothetical protein RMJ51_02770 [Candidatus Calescibacterium sp.]|nr:hypothetical protein [Candidatus Calescibacterium sp.]MCX7972249.1 hypothetical protein [bacterium]MDW8195150.1 hypothetical protein [Candidatus Calescibacterium sp.]
MYKTYEITFSHTKSAKFTFIVGSYGTKVKKNLESLAKKYNVNVIIIDAWKRDYFITLKNPNDTFTLSIGNMKIYSSICEMPSWNIEQQKQP